MVAFDEAADRFWAFSLRVYSPEDAQEAFLTLQDAHGWDVPLALCCLWRGAEASVIAETTMEELIGFSGEMSAHLIQPVRALRRGWKGGIGALPPELTEAARRKIADAEQAIERLQMTRLAQMVCEDAALAEAGSAPRTAIRANLTHYQTLAGLSVDEAARAMIEEQALQVV